MLNLFRAEWQKVVGHRWAAGALIWIWPAGATGVLVIMILVALLGDADVQQAMGIAQVGAPAQWTDQIIMTWNIPNDIVGRFILVAFAAIMFAGEYQWGTWKNLLPRRGRVTIILMKFFTLGVFVVVAFSIASLIVGVGTAIPLAIAGVPYGPAITGEVMSNFLRDFLVQAFTTFSATLLGACFAAVAAMITRNTLAAMMLGFGLVVLEMLSMGLFSLLGWLFGKPEMISLYQFMPSYNLTNITSWITWGRPTPFMQFGYVEPNSLALSMVLLVLWVAGLVTVTTILFRRQDITT